MSLRDCFSEAAFDAYFHLLSELVECFEIPDVPDVAELHPKEFATYQARMRALEWN